jgi:cyclopropane-fatty-acyl-phospholipid synthase
MRVLLALGRHIRAGAVTVVLPDGSSRRFQGAEEGPDAVLEVHDDRVAASVLTRGSLGFCEAYLDGAWSSPDMEALFLVMLLNRKRLESVIAGRGWYRLLQRGLFLMRANTRTGARRNVARHYDLGNDFYGLWLDETMTYSGALYGGRDLPLADAQRAKWRAIADALDLRPGHRLLEIGCGWGGFAAFAAAERGARVTAITISRAQHDFARARIAEAGLADAVEVRLQDYRDVRGRFDRIASIEMLEAVGERYWPVFFRTLADRLEEGGRAALQVITIADRHFASYRRSADYIQRHVFPGGMLPSPGAFVREAAAAGLKVRSTAALGADYARTLREWNRRFQEAWPRIEALGFDGRFKRLWEQYLHYCAAGFAAGTIDVLHVAIDRR